VRPSSPASCIEAAEQGRLNAEQIRHQAYGLGRVVVIEPVQPAPRLLMWTLSASPDGAVRLLNSAGFLLAPRRQPPRRPHGWHPSLVKATFTGHAPEPSVLTREGIPIPILYRYVRFGVQDIDGLPLRLAAGVWRSQRAGSGSHQQASAKSFSRRRAGPNGADWRRRPST
jgi:hypothetical protein